MYWLYLFYWEKETTVTVLFFTSVRRIPNYFPYPSHEGHNKINDKLDNT